jgi:hypothetical protein
MVRAAVRIIRESGALEYENLVDEYLMRQVLVGALSRGKMRVHIDG